MAQSFGDLGQTAQNQTSKAFSGFLPRLFQASRGRNSAEHQQARQAVARMLDALPADCRVYHLGPDSILGTDHIVLTPSAIYVLIDHRHEGNIRCRGEQLLHQRTDISGLLGQARTLAHDCARHLCVDSATVQAMLVFPYAHIELQRPLQGVRISNLRYLQQHLLIGQDKRLQAVDSSALHPQLLRLSA